MNKIFSIIYIWSNKTPEERIDGRACIDRKKTFIIESDSEDEDEEIQEDKEIEYNSTNNIVSIVNNLKKNGISVLEKVNENQLASILLAANKAYYNDNGNSIMTDNVYDIIKEFMEQKYPSK